jgi:hypothetical protein
LTQGHQGNGASRTGTVICTSIHGQRHDLLVAKAERVPRHVIIHDSWLAISAKHSFPIRKSAGADQLSKCLRGASRWSETTGNFPE